MRFFFPFVVLLVLTVSCKNAVQSNSSAIDGIREVIEIPIMKDTVVLCSDFCSRVGYIPLEATEQSLIGDLTKVVVASDGSIITFDTSNSLLLRFGPDGRFLNRIGSVGRMDNEYIRLTDIAYNPYSDEIIAWDNPTHTLMYYDLEGNFLRKSEIEWWTGRISVLDASHLGMSVYENKDGNTIYKYVIATYDGNEIISEIQDNEPIPDMRGAFLFPYVYEYNGRTFCKSEYSSLVSELTVEGLSPVYYISYSNKTIPLRWYELTYDSFDRKLRHNPDIVYTSTFFETPNYYLVNTIKEKFFCLSVLERNGSKRSFHSGYMFNDMYGDKNVPFQWSNFASPKMLSIRGDSVYFQHAVEPIPDDEYAEFRQRIYNKVTDPEEQNLILSKWEEYYKICQNDNPVLLKCTLK